MSAPERWREYFVATDEQGRSRLTSAAAAAVASLEQPHSGPRSAVLPTDLNALVNSLEVCPDEGVALGEVLEDLGTRVFAHGVVPSDPACVAHLHPPTVVPAVVTELTIAATNQSMDSWDQAPVATAVELHLMAWLCGVLGLPSTGSGVMTSGGTASNVLGITLARSRAAAKLGVDVLKEGLPAQARQWRILCSDQAHFSIQRAAAQLGLGRDAVVLVATDADGRMDVAALDATIAAETAQGHEIVALAGTAGTTDLNAIDPLDELATRADALDAWFHVDAAVAGAFALSDTLAPTLQGIGRADSVTVDFHKLWFQPFNASALVVRDVASYDLLRVRSNYLDRGDELEGMINLVGRSLDTSRRFDAAKVLASLRTIGRRDFGAMVTRLHELALEAAASLERRGFALLAPVHGATVVFDLAGYDAEDLRRVQQNLLVRGEAVLGRTTIKGRAALKFTFMNPLIGTDDIERVIGLIEKELSSLRG